MADASADDDAAEYAPLITGRPSAQGQQQQHSSDRENIPEQQQQTVQHRSKTQAKAAQAASKKQLSERRKTSAAEPVQRSIVEDEAAGLATTETDQAAGQQAGRQVLKPIAAGAAQQRTATGTPDPESLIGCRVQPQFEEGLFKVYLPSANATSSPDPNVAICNRRTACLVDEEAHSAATLLHPCLHIHC